MKDYITVIRIDSDNLKDIQQFRKLWENLKVDIVFVPKKTKFIIKGKK